MTTTPSYYSAQEAEDVFAKANEAYYREDYAAAKEAYLKLLQHGYGGEDVLFNLGTSCLALGEVGEAILYLERARKVSNRPEDIDANLSLARERQVDKAMGQAVDEPWVQRLSSSTSENASAAAFLFFWLMGMGLLLGRRLYRKLRRTWILALAMLFLLASLPSAFLLGSHIYARSTIHQAVVLKEALPVREFPAEGARVAFEVHEGLKVRVLETSGPYARIRLPNGREGWTMRDGMERL